MTYGHLTLITGPMFAGKTTELIRRIDWAAQKDHSGLLVLKPSVDTRYDENHIVTHNGNAVKVMPINAWPDIKPDIQKIFIDEVQFLTGAAFPDDLPKRVREALAVGIEVCCSGLDMDWQGRPFVVTAALAAMADDVVKMSARCTICHKAAHHTAKKTPDTKIFELGSEDLYEPRCNQHWQIFNT